MQPSKARLPSVRSKDSAGATSPGGSRRSDLAVVIDRWRLYVDLSLSARVESGPSGDRSVIEVAGEIDVYTAPKLREQLVEIVDAGQYHIVVDMRGVEFLDSTGLGVLVGGLKRVRQHDGSLRLVCTQERILKIFRITGLTKVFTIHDTLEDAL